MRRGSVIQLAALASIAAAICIVVALAIPWLPQAAGKEAQRIDFVFWFTTGIAIAVFSVVIAAIAFSVWKFRARPDDDSDGPPIHGHTGLEIGWTAVPAVLVTAISIVSAIVLAQNSHAGSDPLKIGVHAQQFAWDFTYPNGKKSGFLEIPVNRKVLLDITSTDVIHSFWVPQLGQKQDAVPGAHNRLVITPITKGTFPVICTELCGLGHSLMRSHVNVVSASEYAAWVKGSAAAGGPPGLATFNSFGCGSCHTLSAASATGKIGPNLDNLKAYAAKAGRGSLTQFIQESIVNPGAYIQPGFSNLMPATFKQQIPPDQLAKLVQYLATNAK